MLDEAVECETQFAEDLLGGGVPGLSVADMRAVPRVRRRPAARARSASRRCYGATNPFAFMELQDVQELTNFFERRVSAYQVGVTGTSPSTTTSSGGYGRRVAISSALILQLRMPIRAHVITSARQEGQIQGEGRFQLVDHGVVALVGVAQVFVNDDNFMIDEAVW